MINNILLNFKQGQLADTRENINLLISKMEEQSGGVNEEFLSKNDYIKFHQIEVAGDNDTYSTIIKDKDGTGEIEFVDTLDSDELNVKVVVLLNDDNEVVPIYITDSPTSEAQVIGQDVDKTLDIRFPYYVIQSPFYENYYVPSTLDRITEGELTDSIQAMASQVPDKSERILSVLTATKYEVRDYTGKVIVLLDDNDEIVPLTTFVGIEPQGGITEEFYNCVIYSPAWESVVSSILNKIKNNECSIPEEASEEYKQNFAKMLTATKYEIRNVPYVDKKMKIVGQNMFNAAISSLSSSISSQNTTLASRITELEQRLAILISAFEADPESTAEEEQNEPEP